MFAVPVDMDCESSSNVISEPYLEKPVRPLFFEGRKRYCPRAANCFSKNYGAVENRIHTGDLSCDYDGICSIGRLDLDPVPASVARQLPENRIGIPMKVCLI